MQGWIHPCHHSVSIVPHCKYLANERRARMLGGEKGGGEHRVLPVYPQWRTQLDPILPCHHSVSILLSTTDMYCEDYGRYLCVV